jgi:ATP-dependent helicase/DNAse subunit B
MKTAYNLNLNLAERIKKYFDYIDVSRNYKLEKIQKLADFKRTLIKKEIISETIRDNQEIIVVNEAFLPSFFQGKSRKLDFFNSYSSPIPLTKCADASEQRIDVFDKVVKLLENGISPQDIIILNTNEEDDLALSKYFQDAQIPFVIKKKQSLYTYPLTKSFIVKLREEEISCALEYLDLSSDSNERTKLINLVNAYGEKLISLDIETFIYIIKKQSIQNNPGLAGISVEDFDEVLISDKKHYFLLNYYNEVFPKQQKDNEYLSDIEAQEINYPSSININEYFSQQAGKKIEQIKNIYISYPLKTIDETIQSSLNIQRKFNISNYKKSERNYSYTKTYSLLDFAKRQYDYQNYFIKHDDYHILANTFARDFEEYIPYFNGINQNTLSYLLEKNNTLSGKKVETYNLCPFRFLLQYLLKLDDFSDNIFTFIGTVIHKALELTTKNESFEINSLIESFVFPEEDIFKQKIFQEIIRENIEVITDVVKKIEEISQFNKIETEKKIYQRFDDNFYLSGAIDKVMVDEKYNYYLIIDYKYSEKNYKTTDIDYGFNLQLPFYLYAYKQTNPEKEPAGMLYFQTGVSRSVYGEEPSFKMKGLTIDIDQIIERIDPSLSFISGISAKADGISKKPTTAISKIMMDEILGKTENFIKSAANNIKLGNFEIEPITFQKGSRNNDSISCEYCKFFNICYSKNKRLGGE